jgi:hypothetical protein
MKSQLIISGLELLVENRQRRLLAVIQASDWITKSDGYRELTGEDLARNVEKFATGILAAVKEYRDAAEELKAAQSSAATQ